MAENVQDLEREGAQALKNLSSDEKAKGKAAVKDEQLDPEREDATPEEAAERASADKSRIAQLLDRGVVNDKLNIELPPDRVGFWVREREEDIDRYLALGGRLESAKELGRKGLHGAGDDRIRVGDVVLMTIPRDVHEVIRKIDRDRAASLIKKGKQEFLKQRGAQFADHFQEG